MCFSLIANQIVACSQFLNLHTQKTRIFKQVHKQVVDKLIIYDLENTTRRLRQRENGVIFSYMDVTRPLSRRLRRRVVLSKSIY